MTSRIRPHRMSDRPGIRSITSTGWKPARPCCRARPLNNGTSQHDDPARPCGACAMKLVSIPGNPVPDDVVTGEITTPDGVELRFARWDSPASGKGTVCVFTGRSEFIEKYFETVRDLRKRGFTVAVMDWRGGGGSSRRMPEPPQGRVGSFSDFVTGLAPCLQR